MRPQVRDYMSSLSSELDVQHRRVRSLIGGAHWPTDGHYKEHLLLSLLSRFAPATARLGRGFVIGDFDADRCSRELDIVITDRSREAPLFDEAGVVITSYRRLLAAVSVKSTFAQDELVDAVGTLASVPTNGSVGSAGHSWGGVYFFDDGETEHRRTTLKTWVQQALGNEPARAFAEVYVRASPSLLIKLSPGNVRAYELKNLATAAFLACLLDSLSAVNQERSTFADLSEAVLDGAEVYEL